MNRIASVILLAAAVTAPAQQVAIAPPLSGLMVQYRYWPEQFVQWTGSELPYSMVELDADETGAKPLYDVILTDRTTGKRVHYANQPQLVAVAKAQDGEAYLSQIAMERPDAETTGSIYTVHFTLKDGVAGEWRFVQGSDVMEQGSGLTPLPAAKIPVFAYREAGAVAGEGTAIQIGGAVSNAEFWKEISRPPHFVAYHAALTHGSTLAVLSPGQESWKIDAAPATLANGAAWELSEASGRHLSIRVEKSASPHYLLSVSNGNPAVKQMVEANYDGKQWTIERLRFVPAKSGEDHGLSILFTPALGSAETSTADLIVGKKTKIASASVVGGPAKYELTMKSPEWVKGKQLAGVSAIEGDLLKVAVQPK